jgi:hypothetical protein
MPRESMRSIFVVTRTRSRIQSFCRGVFPVARSRCRKILKHVHNLFTRIFWSSSPAGLRLEITCETDKKKMNLIFNYDKKIFLTGKEARVSASNEKQDRKFREFYMLQSLVTGRSEQSWLFMLFASRVDQRGLRAQFFASASSEQTLTTL